MRINWPLVAIPVLGMVAMGTFFGATQNALSSFGGTFAAADVGGPAVRPAGPDVGLRRPLRRLLAGDGGRMPGAGSSALP